MVKEPKSRRGKMPAINADGSKRGKPGKPARPGEVRSDRLIMRVHPDLLGILSERAREKGLTRSQYVEQILVGWCRLDPRNRRVDMIGKYDPAAPSPEELRSRSSFRFADLWTKFGTVSRLLLGAPPPSEWVDDGNGPPDDLGPSTLENDADEHLHRRRR
jgi:hypothetical protein